MTKRHNSLVPLGKILLGEGLDYSSCVQPASPRSGRKVVAQGGIGPHPARAPLGAKGITTKANGAHAKGIEQLFAFADHSVKAHARISRLPRGGTRFPQ
jgi:hypothetical protein